MLAYKVLKNIKFLYLLAIGLIDKTIEWEWDKNNIYFVIKQ